MALQSDGKWNWEQFQILGHVKTDSSHRFNQQCVQIAHILIINCTKNTRQLTLSFTLINQLKEWSGKSWINGILKAVKSLIATALKHLEH